ncbi:MAG: S41 family peptidase [Cellvibrionales bacterium]|nr:S41 family peptidase [Cellvibrionales bacterium]
MARITTVLLFSLCPLFIINPSLGKSTDNNKASSESHLSLQQIQQFVEVYHQVRERYVEELSDDQLIQFAIAGLLQNLDPHSSYLDQEDFQTLQDSTSGEFAGLGVEVTVENNVIKVISAIDGSPAQDAGIKSGDLVIKVDEHAVHEYNSDAALDLLSGKKGTRVKLTIIRENVSDPVVISVTRDIIKLKSVQSQLLTQDYGYLKIKQFQRKTASDAKKQLKRLTKMNRAPLKGLIIDLRNNPGGLLTPAIAFSDFFLTTGLITFTKGREVPSEKFYATPKEKLPNAQLVVLVNGGSASSSEIVSGALQDHGRALILGTKTFGKGSVQSIIPIGEKTALKLTTARYFTPKGRSIQAKGIRPDITIKPAEIVETSDEPLFQERHLKGHLTKKEDTQNQSIEAIAKLKTEDFQLYEALNILKSMVLMNKRQNAIDPIPVISAIE